MIFSFIFRAQASVLLLVLSLMLGGCSLVQITDKPDTGLDHLEGDGKIISRIELLGLKYTKETFIRRHLYSQEGQSYSARNAQLDYARLDGLAIFSSITFDTREDGDKLVLVIIVSENAPWLPGINMTISDETGFSIGPSVSFGNFLGRGMKLSVSARFGGATTYQALFSTPWYGDGRPQVVAQVYRLNRDNRLDNFQETSLEANLDLLWSMGKNFRIGPRFTLLQMNSDTPGITISDSNEDFTYGFGFFLGRDSRNFLSYPTKGGVLFFDTIRYYGDMQTNRSSIDARWYFSLFERHRIGVYSLTTFSSGEIGVDIPLWADFHIGGTNTVRGWDIDSRRGKNQSIAVMEYGFMVLERKIVRVGKIQMDMGIQLAVFGDVGTAWNESQGYQDNFIAGGGVGLRLIMPTVGMVRFDFASGQPEVGIQFHIGSKERATAQRFRVR